MIYYLHLKIIDQKVLLQLLMKQILQLLNLVQNIKWRKIFDILK
jgi:hypothetical protein